MGSKQGIVGLSGQVVRIWTIFQHPLDAPDKYIVRGFSILPHIDPVPDEQGYAVDTLEQARALLPDGLFCLGRDARDDPTIVESWI